MIDIEKIKKKIKEEGNIKESEYKGYKYIIIRMNEYEPNRINLNGYVVIPENHLFKIDYNSSYCGHSGCYEHTPESIIDVHGGLTYSGDIEFSDGEHYCLGFDTAHSGDVWTFEYIEKHAEYRNMEYVENECKRMIDQLISIQKHQEVQ